MLRPDPKPEPRKKKAKKYIRQVSVKRQGLNKQYRIVRDQYLLENFKCEKCLFALSTEVHHQKGKIGALLIDTAYFMGVCRPCHQFIELNPATAIKMGWSFKRLDI
jgi:hypothetical protein